jgi:hypothetical protein
MDSSAVKPASLWSRPWATPLAAALLFIAVVASRLPFASRMLYAWDSANFALALDYYNVAWHQPHPPGYPLYVGLAKLLNLWLDDANASFVFISIATSAGAVVLLFLLASRMYGSWVGLTAAVLLGASVGFWGYGEVAYSYTSLAFFGTLMAWLCYLMWQGKTWPAVLAGLALGIAGGVRQDLLLLLGPLWLVSVWQTGLRRLVLSGLALSLTAGSWLYVAAELSGGWAMFQEVNAAQSGYIAATYSILSGGSGQLRHNAATLLLFVQQMFGVALLVVIYSAGRFLTLKNLVSDWHLAFLLLWFLPPTLVYLLLHIGEPGYVLSLLPVLSIVAAAGIRDIAVDARSALLLLSGRHYRLGSLGRAAGGVGATLGALIVAALVAWNANAFLTSYGPGRLIEIRHIDTILETQIEYARRYEPGSVVILAKQNYRQFRYYLPSYNVRLLFDEYQPGYPEARYSYRIPEGMSRVLVMDFASPKPWFPAERGGEVALSSNPRYWASVWQFGVAPGETIEHGFGYLAIKGR